MPAYRRSGGARRPVHDYGPPLTAQDQARMRHAPPLRVGKRCAFVGRLQPTTKLRATWCLRFGPGGRAYEVTCTASRKSRKREVFADGCLVHSGGLGLREHGGGAGGADAPLFAHAYGAPACPRGARPPPPPPAGAAGGGPGAPRGGGGGSLWAALGCLWEVLGYWGHFGMLPNFGTPFSE